MSKKQSVNSDVDNQRNNNIDLTQYIAIRGACENNLKNVSINIPKNKFVVITGPSGSGKSSLAFDTIYAEGQRRYMENLSSYARYFIGSQNKPNVESIKGLNPTIAIDQKTTSRNPRSTVGTITDIYDYVRLLFSRIGKVYSPVSGEQLVKYSKQEIIALISLLPLGTKIRLLAPVIKHQKGSFITELSQLKNQEIEKVRIDGKFVVISETLPELDKEKEHTIEIVVDRIIMKENMDDRIHKSVERCLQLSDNVVVVNVVEFPNGIESFKFNEKAEIKTGGYLNFSTQYVDGLSNFVLENIEPKVFSFNSPYGACPYCNGLGTEVFFKEDLVVPDDNLTLMEGAIEPWQFDQQRYHNQLLIALSKKYNFDLNIPYKNLDEKIKKILMYGTGDEFVKVEFIENMRTTTTSIKFVGAIGELNNKIKDSANDPILLAECERYQNITRCHMCNGYRLKKDVLQVKICDKNIGEICDMPIEKLIIWVEQLPSKLDAMSNNIAKPILNEIKNRLRFLIDVGLDYLTLIRSAHTLSGGEAQRIRLSTQLGSGLCGVIYVLDEPSIGLHQADNDKLINTIKKLRDSGNSVIVIEHDEETMKNADYLIDVGPNAGMYGGEIVDEGTPKEIAERKKGMTGKFLSEQIRIQTPKARRMFGNNEFIELIGASENNLKNINIKIPLGKFIVVSGVSGGGKSTLILDTLYPAIAQKIGRSKVKPGKFMEIKGTENIDKIIKIDQDPIGRTPRSNPSTYIGIFTMIRDVFADQDLSIRRGYKSGRFSFNTKGGRCENCQGDGMVKIEMQLLQDVYVKCPVCNGRRYNKETLEVQYNGYSIDEVLNLSVREALEVFKDEILIKEKLEILSNVGLDYIKLGQSATTLSGGEAQRIRLSKELSRKATGNTLYVLDEPTTGLHSCDIKQLLFVLNQLVDSGNTVIVIEHNLDVIKVADYVIDIGPKGGDSGGYIVAEGKPEDIANNENSITGKYLKNVLKY